MSLKPTMLNLVTRVWAPEVLVILKTGGQNFNRLLGAIPGISDRLLTVRLTELCAAGLAERHVQMTPLRVTYHLTSRGHRAAAAVAQLVASLDSLERTRPQ